MSKFKPRRVRVIWKPGCGDWSAFELLDLRKGWALLRGVDEEDGTPHDGDRFWVQAKDIEDMVEV